MIWNKHLNLESSHCLFSPSKYSWLNYSDDKALEVYNNLKKVELGTRLHAWAKETIELKLRQANRKNNIIYKYINDAIDYRMDPEVLLYFSPYFYGTADAISFYKNVLRIHDLKTGETSASFNQLMIYMALFCLEYDYRPTDIEAELRLYQLDDVQIHLPEPEQILNIMDKIIRFDKAIEKTKIGG